MTLVNEVKTIKPKKSTGLKTYNDLIDPAILNFSTCFEIRLLADKIKVGAMEVSQINFLHVMCFL